MEREGREYVIDLLKRMAKMVESYKKVELLEFEAHSEEIPIPKRSPEEWTSFKQGTKEVMLRLKFFKGASDG